MDPNSPLGKLESFGKAMEDSAKKMEAAQKSGDANAQASAALEGLGTLFGGGKRVDPIGIDQLKTFVPEAFGGMPKTSNSAEKTGLPGLMVSTAEAHYGDGQKTIELEVVDTGGVSGLVGVAAWAGIRCMGGTSETPGPYSLGPGGVNGEDGPGPREPPAGGSARSGPLLGCWETPRQPLRSGVGVVSPSAENLRIPADWRTTSCWHP